MKWIFSFCYSQDTYLPTYVNIYTRRGNQPEEHMFQMYHYPSLFTGTTSPLKKLSYIYFSYMYILNYLRFVLVTFEIRQLL